MVNALRWWWGILLAFSLLAASRLVAPLPFVIEVIIFSIYTMGCNFLLGRVGFISFGQPAYLAAGAYGTAFYLFYFGTDPYVGILVGVLSGLAVSAIVGPLFVRLRSDYFALVNLALAVIIYYLMQKVLADITKGDNGLWFLTRIASNSTSISTTRSLAPAASRPNSTRTSSNSSATAITACACSRLSLPTRRPRWPARCMRSTWDS
jgi:ABC-type branched-subunit amino acid transport system permease subunit